MTPQSKVAPTNLFLSYFNFQEDTFPVYFFFLAVSHPVPECELYESSNFDMQFSAISPAPGIVLGEWKVFQKYSVHE